MSRIRELWRLLWADRRGATAIEYAMLASVGAILAATAIFAYGDSLDAMYNTLTKTITTTLDNSGK